MLETIDDYAIKQGNTHGITISNTRIATELNVTTRTVTNSLNVLESLGLIKTISDRHDPTNTKRTIKPVKLPDELETSYSIDQQVTGVIGWVNRLLKNNYELPLDNDDTTIRNHISNAIEHYGSDKELIAYLDHNKDYLMHYDALLDWLDNFSGL